jgi:hypothetical protein
MARERLRLPTAGRRATFSVRNREPIQARSCPSSLSRCRVTPSLGGVAAAVTAKIYVHLYGREQAEERFRQAMAQ